MPPSLPAVTTMRPLPAVTTMAGSRAPNMCTAYFCSTTDKIDHISTTKRGASKNSSDLSWGTVPQSSAAELFEAPLLISEIQGLGFVHFSQKWCTYWEPDWYTTVSSPCTVQLFCTLYRCRGGRGGIWNSRQVAMRVPTTRHPTPPTLHE